jgi:hypothetical protein
MIKSFAVCVLALLALQVCSDHKPYRGPSEADVIVLEPSTFEDAVYQSEDPWLI